LQALEEAEEEVETGIERARELEFFGLAKELRGSMASNSGSLLSSPDRQIGELDVIFTFVGF